LNQYDTLDNIIAHADEIPGKVGESLRENLVQLELSRKLATIDCDVALDLEPEQLTQSAPDLDTLRELYTRLEMNSLLRQLPGAGQDAPDAMTPQPAAMKTHYHIVLTLAELRSWKTRLEKAELSALDTETTGLDYMQAELVGVCISVQAGEAAYIPVAHDYPGAPEQLARDTVLAELKPWLENSEHLKVGHHIKYDAHILARYDINLRGIAHDTMLESYVLDSTATRHDMDSVARKYLGVETTSFEQVAGKGAKQLTFNQVELGLAAHYAAEDADITLRLHQVMWERLSHHTMLRQVYQDIEIPLVSVLQHMEHTGVLIDTFMLARQSKELAQGMHELELQAHEAAGGPFNVASPKQLQEILFERLQLPVIRKTPKGQPSTAEDVLQELAIDYPLPRLILEHRSMAKLKSTYTDKLPGQVDRTTGRVHTSYHQAVAATGRLSSSDPNLQNIPIRTAEGRRIRQAFIAPKGYCLIAADYSQIELRIMAHLSGDPGLLKAFAEDRDIHQATAAEVFGVDLDAVSKDQRRSAKAINFGLIYGMSAFGLARQLNIGRSEAQDYVNLYFERYPGVKAYMDNTRKLAKEQGYVETVFGRRLYLPEINSRNGQLRQYAERSAINAPMQGTAADIIKLAMIGVDTWLQSSPVDARLIMQVHDELVVEVRDEEAAAVQKELVRRMSQAASLKVPLKVDAARGLNWDEAH
jgi:DNA polymerase-1